MKDLVLETAYTGSKGTSLFYALNVNQPYPVGGLLGSGSQQSRRLYPTFANITREQNSGDSHFHAFQAKVERRLTAGLSMLGTYMWSKSIGQFICSRRRRCSGCAESGGAAWSVRLRCTASLCVEFQLRDSRSSRTPVAQFRSAGPGSSGLADGRHSDSPGRTSDGRRAGAETTAIPAAATIGRTWSGIRTAERKARPTSGMPARLFRLRQAPSATRPEYLDRSSHACLRLSLMKNISSVRTRREKAQFRAEFFNILNHPIWANPASQVNVATFGTIRSNAGQYHVASNPARLEDVLLVRPM